jgi:pentatricopeptide repeat protein
MDTFRGSAPRALRSPTWLLSWSYRTTREYFNIDKKRKRIKIVKPETRIQIAKARMMLQFDKPWRPVQYEEVKKILDYFRKLSIKSTKSFTITKLSIDLFVRLAKDVSHRRRKRKNEPIPPETIDWIQDPTYINPIIMRWGYCAERIPSKVYKVEAFIHMWKYIMDQLPDFRCNIVIPKVIMDVYLRRTPKKELPLKLEELVKFIQPDIQKRPELRLDVFAYGRLLHAWASSRREESTDQIDRILKEMQRENMDMIVPSVCDRLLHYWVRHREAQRAAEFLLRMKEWSHLYDIQELRPTYERYNLVISWFARAADVQPITALQLHNQMLKEKIQLHPDSMAALVTTLSKSSDDYLFLQRADELLVTLEDVHRPDLQPNYWHYNRLISGFVKLGHMEEAHDVLMRSIRAYVNRQVSLPPSSVMVDVVVEALLQSRDLRTATALVDQLHRLAESTLIPIDSIGTFPTYESLLRAWQQSTEPTTEINVNTDKLEQIMAHCSFQKPRTGE